MTTKIPEHPVTEWIQKESHNYRGMEFKTIEMFALFGKWFVDQYGQEPFWDHARFHRALLYCPQYLYWVKDSNTKKYWRFRDEVKPWKKPNVPKRPNNKTNKRTN